MENKLYNKGDGKLVLSACGNKQYLIFPNSCLWRVMKSKAFYRGFQISMYFRLRSEIYDNFPQIQFHVWQFTNLFLYLSL